MLKSFIGAAGRAIRSFRTLNRMYAPKRGTSVGYGRVSLHGITLRRVCPHCGKRVKIGFTGTNGLWDPKVGVPVGHRVQCPKCSSGWTIVVFLHVLLEVQKDLTHLKEE